MTAVQSNDAMGDGVPSATNAASELPAWMVARRERESGVEVEEAVSFTEAEPEHESEPEPEISLGLTFPPPPPRPKRKRPVPVITITDEQGNKVSPDQNWLNRWISSHGMIGMGVSLLFHTIVLLSLAFIIISQVSKREDMSLWGVVDTGDEVGGDFLLDTAVPVEAGAPAPLQMTDLTQVMEGAGAGNNFAETTREGALGKGKGDGESGDGAAMGAGSLKVPGHAQTKGSFSAWPEPRDPKPLQNYHIVVQIRLPRAAKKYRASDLSGVVTGTDKYKQEIRYKPGETFEIENGAVEIRVLVPGGAQRVRDTIFIESKLLREKQTFEIEF